MEGKPLIALHAGGVVVAVNVAKEAALYAKFTYSSKEFRTDEVAPQWRKV